MNRTILLAVDAARHAGARHVAAAARETQDLSLKTGDRVVVLHVHEFAHSRFGRLQVDCAEGEGRVHAAAAASPARDASFIIEGLPHSLGTTATGPWLTTG